MSALADDALSVLPVFPLPRVVLLPHEQLPLHLFEPRYRAMISDCLAKGPRAIAIALLRPGWERGYEGRPPVHEIAGVGEVCEHVAHPDGTYDVLLRGVARVRLEELPADGLVYRRARATMLTDELPPGGVAHADVAALVGTASSVAAEIRRRYPQFELGLSGDDAPSRLADVIADRLVADAELRQEILETTDVAARVRLVTHAVAELLAHASTRRAAPSA